MPRIERVHLTLLNHWFEKNTWSKYFGSKNIQVDVVQINVVQVNVVQVMFICDMT